MRMKKILLFILPCIFIWIIITYYLLISGDQISNNPLPRYQDQLARIERDIGKEFEKKSLLLNDLKNIFKFDNIALKEDTTKHLNEVGNNENIEDNEIRKLDDSVTNNDNKIEQPAYNFKVKIDGFSGPIIPVIVFACNRVSVNKCLDQLIQYRPSKEQFPIIVSQDCDHEHTRDVILSYGDALTLIQQPDQSEINVPPREKKFKGYFKIARHYGWALNQTFLNFGFDSAIIVEDDLDIAPDFYEYFLGTYPILKSDNTLWCVSAWNDNGKIGLVDENNPSLLYRTDFFPGLGWMLTKELWIELAPKWPKSYWDDWIRQPQQRKERSCIRPELSRTHTFGKIGVSNGLFFEKHLKYIKLNEQYVPFTKMNLTYLLKDNYDAFFVREVYNSAVVSYQELRSNNIAGSGPVRIPYHTKDTYKKTAKMLGLMDDFKSGVPRMGYRGVVSFYYSGRRVYLAPQASWKGYDISWS